ncbi:MAG: hypothetical protein MUO95_09405 [Methanoregula sp.]|nr:hypothetical protein [Methanoregula sp.]
MSVFMYARIRGTKTSSQPLRFLNANTLISCFTDMNALTIIPPIAFRLEAW